MKTLIVGARIAAFINRMGLKKFTQFADGDTPYAASVHSAIGPAFRAKS